MQAKSAYKQVKNCNYWPPKAFIADSLEANILAALVNTAHGEVASKIKQLDQHYIAHKLAHAIAGCAAASANKGKCQDGAIGAAVGEIVGEQLLKGRTPSSLTSDERSQIIAYARLVAGTSAVLVGGDSNTAADRAKVAVENNGLLDRDGRTPDEREKERRVKEYGTNLNEIANKIKTGSLVLTRELANYIYQLNHDPKFVLEVNTDGWDVYIPKDAKWFPNPKNNQEQVATGRIPYLDTSRWLVHGNVSVIRGSNGKYRMVEEDYDFEMHDLNKNPSLYGKSKTSIRNLETRIGNPGIGVKFKIKFKGNVNVIH